MFPGGFPGGRVPFPGGFGGGFQGVGGFAPGGHYRQQRGRGREAQLLMVAIYLWQQIERLPYKPPATLAAIALQCALFFGSMHLDIHRVCLNALDAVRTGLASEASLFRLLVSPVAHADEQHLLINMSSFLLKGAQLEARYGTQRFAVVLVILTALTQAFYVALCVFMGHRECGVGFSGVIFALKSVANVDAQDVQQIYGFSVPTKLAAWAELVLISIMSPHTSFYGHLAGILAGLGFVYAERTVQIGRVDVVGLLRKIFGLDFAEMAAAAAAAAGGVGRRAPAGAAPAGAAPAGVAPAAPAPAGAGAGAWACPSCNLRNGENDRACSACGERRRGVWGAGYAR